MRFAQSPWQASSRVGRAVRKLARWIRRSGLELLLVGVNRAPKWRAQIRGSAVMAELSPAGVNIRSWWPGACSTPSSGLRRATCRAWPRSWRGWRRSASSCRPCIYLAPPVSPMRRGRKPSSRPRRTDGAAVEKEQAGRRRGHRHAEVAAGASSLPVQARAQAPRSRPRPRSAGRARAPRAPRRAAGRAQQSDWDVVPVFYGTDRDAQG